ncbi:unnamed protein product [Gongylonema pulchrum]|uniref:Uncharacterized protein n=1 Tax=Gongylonema pulchrum TaxID=637853 RepID=A0A183CZF6_9BILA|nr:unnamed protein product [Gongylonema pulchrum]
MVRPVVSDPGDALLAFSKSFKKIRRAGTTYTARSGRRRKNREKLSKCKYRSTSLPNLKDLCEVVRDNVKQPEGKRQSSAVEALIPLQARSWRRRSKSVFSTATALKVAPTSAQSNGYYQGPYWQPNGPSYTGGAPGSVVVPEHLSITSVPNTTLHHLVKQAQIVSSLSRN